MSDFTEKAAGEAISNIILIKLTQTRLTSAPVFFFSLARAPFPFTWTVDLFDFFFFYTYKFCLKIKFRSGGLFC